MRFYKCHTFATWWKSVADLLFPRYCSVCNRRLSVTESHICAPCLYTLPLVKHVSFTDNPLTRTFWGLLPIEHGTAFFFYNKESAYRKILWDLKYRGRPQIGEFMGRMMAQRLAPTGFFNGIDFLIPVPLAPERQRARGYNQSERIAQGIATVTQLPIDTRSIVRTVHNTTQTRLHRLERQKNVQGIFHLKTTEHLCHKHVLLIDDVMTTGATLLSCGEALATIPDIKISILTLAWAKE